MTHEYMLLECSGSGQLGMAVTRALADGWELWGNPFSTTNMFGDNWFHQALVRQVESEHGGIRMAEQPAGYTVGVPETPGEVQETPEALETPVVENADPLQETIPISGIVS